MPKHAVLISISTNLILRLFSNTAEAVDIHEYAGIRTSEFFFNLETSKLISMHQFCLHM